MRVCVCVSTMRSHMQCGLERVIGDISPTFPHCSWGMEELGGTHQAKLSSPHGHSSQADCVSSRITFAFQTRQFHLTELSSSRSLAINGREGIAVQFPY